MHVCFDMKKWPVLTPTVDNGGIPDVTYEQSIWNPNGIQMEAKWKPNGKHREKTLTFFIVVD